MGFGGGCEKKYKRDGKEHILKYKEIKSNGNRLIITWLS